MGLDVLRSPLDEMLARWGYGPHRRLSDYWAAVLRKDPGLLSVEVFVEVRFGDVVVRATTAPTGAKLVSGRDGTEYGYTVALKDSPTIESSVKMGDATSAARSVRISLPVALVKPRTLIRRGRMLAGSGEISIAVPGGDHDERIVLLAGDVDDGVSWDQEGGWITCSITDPKATAERDLPPVAVDSDRWPSAHASAFGLRYPLPINRFSGIPCPCVDATGDPAFLISLGHGWTVSTTTGIYVNGDLKQSTDPEYAWAVEETVDARGAPATLVRFSGTHVWDFTETVHAAVTGAVGAVDLLGAIRYLVEGFSGVGRTGYDGAAHGLALARLGQAPEVRVLVNGSSSESAAGCLEFIESTLLRGFPMVSMKWGVGGYGPVVYDRRTDLVAGNLVAGTYPLIERVSEVQETPKTSICNVFSSRYGADPVSGNYSGTATRDPESSALCSVSAQECGRRSYPALDSPFVFDQADADTSIDWLAAHKAIPSYYVEYDALPVAILLFRVGDAVTLTDDEPEIEFSGDTAIIERVSWTKGKVTLGFRVWNPFFLVGGGAGGASSAVNYNGSN
jgi:hypothetical protein